MTKIYVFYDSFENLSSIDIMRQLFKLAYKYKGYDIQPRGYTTSDLYNDNPFIKEILRTGRDLSLK
jgi:hypothetical protein